jgi:RNA polymerase sigma factor (sigma-70 family)
MSVVGLEPVGVRRPADMTWDQLMMARIAAGDDRALGELYNVLSAYVYGLARRVTRSAQAAEEITQEVFLSVWTKPEQVDCGRGTLRSFCGVVTHRRSVDWIRREERRKAREERVALDHPDALDVADLTSQAVMAQAVRNAVSCLPPDQRIAIELAYFDGLSYREVAVRLGIPEGTAKSRLRLAMTKLNDRLTAAGMETAL